MDIETKRNMAYELYELFNRHDIDSALAMCEPDIKIHGAASRPIEAGKFRQVIQSMWQAFPDMVYTVEDVIVEGNKVVVRHSYSGNNTGPYLGIAPTNKRVTVPAVLIARLGDSGKIQESWLFTEHLTLLRQIDAVGLPERGQP